MQKFRSGGEQSGFLEVKRVVLLKEVWQREEAVQRN